MSFFDAPDGGDICAWCGEHLPPFGGPEDPHECEERRKLVQN